MAATLQKSTNEELRKLAKKEKVSLTGLKVKSDIVRAIIDHRAKASKAKSMTTGKAATKKAPAKKAPAKKAPVKKAPVKKAAPKKAAVTEPKKKAPVKVETLVGKMKLATVRDRLVKAALSSKGKEDVIRDRLIAHLKQERRTKAAKKGAATKKATAKAAPKAAAPKKAPVKAAPKKAPAKKAAAKAPAEPKKKAPVKVETLVGKMKLATVRDRLVKAALSSKGKEDVIRDRLIAHLKQERRTKAAKKAAATKKAAAKAAPKAAPKQRAKAKRCTDVEDPIVCEDEEVCLTKTGKCAKDTPSVRAGKNMYVLTLGSDRKIVGIKATLERLKKIFEATGQEDITLEPATAKEKKAVAETAKKVPVVIIESEDEESEGEETEELKAKVSEEETEGGEGSESEGEELKESEEGEKSEEEKSREEDLEALLQSLAESPVKSKTPKAASPKKTPAKKASPKAAAREVPEQKIVDSFKECLSRM